VGINTKVPKEYDAQLWRECGVGAKMFEVEI
jgi:hypothetical protein